MKDKLDKALEVTKLRHTLFLEQRRLTEKFNIESLYDCNGGSFRIDQTFLAFITTAMRDDDGSLVVIDIHGRPILISDVDRFVNDAWGVYRNAARSFLTEYDSLRKKRTVKAIVKL